MLDTLISKLLKFAPYLAFGAMGAIIKGIRKKMPMRRFIGQIFVSAFVAWCLGVTLEHYLKVPINVIYAIVSISGMFSDIILDEIESALKQLKEVLFNFLPKRNDGR